MRADTEFVGVPWELNVQQPKPDLTTLKFTVTLHDCRTVAYSTERLILRLVVMRTTP